MSNTTTGLIPVLYQKAIEVAREMTGAVQAVNTNFDDRGAGKDQTIRVPISPTQSEGDYSPAQTVTVGDDRDFTYADVKMEHSKESSFYLSGEDLRSFTSGGNDIANDTWVQSVMQGMRTLVNGMETRLAAHIYKNASRATGTAGTAPFGSNINETADIKKILDDNGAPRIDRSLVINTTAGANLRKNGIFKVNEAGTDATLREGDLLKLNGLIVRESDGISTHTTGDGSGYLVNGALNAGDTDVTVDTGSGTILQGDIITFDEDTNKYVVTSTLSGTDLDIGNPGVISGIDNDTAITLNTTNFAPNIALWRGAVQLVSRPPVIPESPIIKQTPITDENTGLTFLLVEAPGDGLTTWRLHLQYGFKVTQGEFVAVLLG